MDYFYTYYVIDKEATEVLDVIEASDFEEAAREARETYNMSNVKILAEIEL